MNTTCCAYCNAEIETTEQAETANEQPPAVSDDAAWSELAKEHGKKCEWIITRAHRVFSNSKAI